MTIRRWTEEEKQYLRDNYAKTPLCVLSNKLGRDSSVIMKYASRMGITLAKKRERVAKLHATPSTRAGWAHAAGKIMHKWTEEEDLWLVNNATKVFVDEAADALNLSTKQIKTRICALRKQGLIPLGVKIGQNQRVHTEHGRWDYGYANVGIFVEGGRRWVRCIVK